MLIHSLHHSVTTSWEHALHPCSATIDQLCVRTRGCKCIIIDVTSHKYKSGDKVFRFVEILHSLFQHDYYHSVCQTRSGHVLYHKVYKPQIPVAF